MKALLRCIGAVLACGMLEVASASFISIGSATLNGGSETPPTVSTATGSVTVLLDGNLLEVILSFSGLIGGPAEAAHIHCCTPPGTNAMVALPFTGFPVATSGTYTNTFDLTDSSVYAPTFLTDSGGTAANAEATLLAGIDGGEAYVNIHDANFPGGEIRGFITPPSSSVPEPSTAPVLAAALGGLLFAIRRRFSPPE